MNTDPGSSAPDDGTAAARLQPGGSTRVEEVMTRPAVVVRPDATFGEMANLLRRHRISGLPVVDGVGRLVGVVSERDLLRRLLRAGTRRAPTGSAGALMVQPALSTTPDATVDVTLELMRRRGLRRLPVVDPEGHVLGIVSRTDLLQPYARTDLELRHELLTGVLPRLGVDTTSVDLVVDGGNVDLRGTAAGHEQVTLIEEAVRDTPGVVFVESRLRDRRPHTGGGSHGTG